MSKPKKSAAAKNARPSRATPTAKAAPMKERPASKSNQILSLLRRKQGASLGEMQLASGWQSHSVRGYLSGTVKKRMGLKLSSTRPKDGERRYAIAAG
jgi:Protein of unknown function (DUF3489)